MESPSMPVPKPHWRLLSSIYKDNRTIEQITEHYLLERFLAQSLKSAPETERLKLYGASYDKLYASLPHHPRFTRRYDVSHAGKQVAVLKRLVPQHASFLEIGAGDCSVSLAMAAWCFEAIAVDVTRRPAPTTNYPTSFRFELSDGISLPLGADTVDFAYSHQLMEHLHPEDAALQLKEIYRVLRPGGTYFCITPSKLTGPHDVSRYFDHEAMGLHLREYSYDEIIPILRGVGFESIRACITRGNRYAGSLPTEMLVALEHGFEWLPIGIREKLSRSRLTRAVLGLSVLASKAAKDKPL